jgi:hypothetical protein
MLQTRTMKRFDQKDVFVTLNLLLKLKVSGQ